MRISCDPQTTHHDALPWGIGIGEDMVWFAAPEAANLFMQPMRYSSQPPRQRSLPQSIPVDHSSEAQALPTRQLSPSNMRPQQNDHQTTNQKNRQASAEMKQGDPTIGINSKSVSVSKSVLNTKNPQDFRRTRIVTSS